MGPWRTISVALSASTSGYTSGLAGASAATRKFGTEVEATTKRAGGGWLTFGKVAAVGVGLLAAALTMSIKEAISWESAFAGVRKTVDATEAEYAALSKTLIDMSLRMPATREEIAGVAEAAGQLGVRKEDIAGFTEVMIGLGSATNLSADQAATGLARLMNIMGTSGDDVEKLGATLVDLGNKGASTEAEILEMATRMAGGGKLIGLTEANVLALANAMSSLGVQSELGSGVMTRFTTKLYTAIQGGGEELDKWAKAARMSATEFADAYRTDPVQAIDAVVAGMAATKEEGGNVVAILDDLGLKGTLNTQVLTAMAGGYDVLHQSIKDGNAAWEDGTALQTEVAERYKTAASQLAVFRNQITNVARIVGAELIPMMLAAVAGARDFASWIATVGGTIAGQLTGAWSDLVDTGGNVVEILGDLWEAGAPIVGLFAKLAAALVIGGLTVVADLLERTTGFLADHGEAVAIVAGAYLGLKAAMLLSGAFDAVAVGLYNVAGSIGKLRGGISAIGDSLMAGTTALGLYRMAFAGIAAGAALAFLTIQKSASKARAEVEKLKPEGFDAQSIADLSAYADKIRESGSAAQAASDANRTWGLDAVAGVNRLKALGGAIGVWNDDVTDSHTKVLELSKAQKENERQLETLRSTYLQASDDINGTTSSVEHALAIMLGGDTSRWDDEADAIGRWAAALDLPPEVVNDPKALAAAIAEGKSAAENGTPATDALAGSYETLADETSTATDKLKAWKELVDQIFGTPMTVEDAITGWGEAISTLTGKLKENAWGGFDELTEAGRNNRDALQSAAQSALDLAKAYAEAGRTDEAVVMLANTRQALLDAGVAAGLSKDDVQEFLDKLGLVDGNYQAVIDALVDPNAAGEAEAALNWTARDRTARILAMVESGVSPGRINAERMDRRWGGVHEVARWGRVPAHVAKDPTILYGERATGGEAMVPRFGDAARSMGILQTAAGWYGAQVVPAAQMAPHRPTVNISTGGGGGGGGVMVAAGAVQVDARGIQSGAAVGRWAAVEMAHRLSNTGGRR